MTNQSWSAENYQREAAYVAKLGKSLIEWLQPQVDETILDLGCGDGTLTLELMKSGATVKGIDGDPSMVAAAKGKGITVEQVSATELPYEAEFDAVFSSAALHWMRPPEQVIKRVHQALKPGGRFVAEMGGAGNVNITRVALKAALARRGIDGEQYDPWYFPSAEEYKSLLEANGFEVQRILLYPRPTPIGREVIHWVQNFGRRFVEPIPESEQPAFMNEVVEQVVPQLEQDEQGYLKDYVRLRFVAVKQ
ncbi:Trans-aconitate 2-methyltransferase [Polystyrenella longa]|uniref:Trans-aconitate 2-methyltransferase n=1 Tax=Polystyrenella longa TaxID=2528007 RepID=A0A518CHE7_9PLAN|nr:class I SAM-dependent methyltransferase [Polystyrenella longa]QDU78594.1 Trans-aconitate 2-methyltransferase [Polystyrenella longa]